jgi:ribosomal protein L29
MKVDEKRNEVHKMTDEELGIEVKRLRLQLHTIRSQFVTEKVEDSSRYGKTRKEIARVMTEQNARRTAKN